MIKHFVLKFLRVSLILVTTIVILAMYAHEANRLELLPLMQSQAIDGRTLLFTSLLSLPAVIICFWSFVVRNEVLIPGPRIKRIKWWIVVSKWRVAFVTALLGLAILKLVS